MRDFQPFAGEYRWRPPALPAGPVSRGPRGHLAPAADEYRSCFGIRCHRRFLITQHCRCLCSEGARVLFQPLLGQSTGRPAPATQRIDSAASQSSRGIGPQNASRLLCRLQPVFERLTIDLFVLTDGFSPPDGPPSRLGFPIWFIAGTRICRRRLRSVDHPVRHCRDAFLRLQFVN